MDGRGYARPAPYTSLSYLTEDAGVTVSAVSHRIRRIKDKAKESTGSGVDGNTIAEPAVKSPATPAKRKRSRKTDEAASKKAKAGDDEVEDL